MFFEPSTTNGVLNIDNPVEVNWMPAEVTMASELNYFYFQNGWSKDDAVVIEEDGDNLSFETTRSGWQLCGQELGNSNFAQLTVSPTGYGIVPNDFKAFVVFKDRNIVLALDADLASLTATGMIPTGEEINVVLMVMDFFRLNVGIQALTLTGEESLVVDTDRILPEEMISRIKALDE